MGGADGPRTYKKIDLGVRYFYTRTYNTSNFCLERRLHDTNGADANTEPDAGPHDR